MGTTEDSKGKKATVDIGDGLPKQRKEEKEVWKRPETGYLKMKVDASFSSKNNIGTFGVVVHDERGNTTLYAWGPLMHVMCAEYAESLACVVGIKAIIISVAKPVHLESDCSSVVQELNATVKSKSSIAGIIL